MAAGDPSYQSHRCAPNKTLGSSLPSPVPKISHAQTIVQNQPRSVFRDQSHQFEKRAQGDAKTSSQWPSSTRRVPKGPYSCDICRKVYAQPQGVKRHQRETHSTNTCTYCGDFKWGRPYRFREHLKRRHPDVDPDVALDEASRIHRRATTTRRYLPQQRVSTHIPENNLGGRRAESKMRPLTSGQSAIAGVTAISPSIMSFASYNPQSESAVSIMKRRHNPEYAPELQYLDVSDAHTALSTTVQKSMPDERWT